MLNSIQILRAIAAWVVVFHHYVQVVQIVQGAKLEGSISSALHSYGSIGVDLFFVISGFVICVSSSGDKITPPVFAVRRLSRIVPAYWFFTLITAGLLLLMPGVIPLTTYDHFFLLQSLFFIPAQNPSGIGAFPLVTVGWTLNYEMFFYVVFFACLYLPFKYRVPAAAIALVTLQELLPALGGLFVFYGNTIVYEFLIGVLVALAYQKGLLAKVSHSMSFVLVCLALWVIYYYGPVSHSPWKSGLPCALILMSAIASERLFRKVRILSVLGDWSYSTYLSHVLVISLWLVAQKYSGLNDAVVLVMIVVSVVLMSWLSFKFIERPVCVIAKKALNRHSSRLIKA